MLIQVYIFGDILIYGEIFWEGTLVVVQIVYETIVGEISVGRTNKPIRQQFQPMFANNICINQALADNGIY